MATHSHTIDIETTVSEQMQVHGISDVYVDVIDTQVDTLKRVRIYKPVLNDFISYTFSTSDIHDTNVLSVEAERAAQEFKEELTTVFEWAIRGTHRLSDISIHDGGWAHCAVCGTQISISDSNRSQLSEADAEMTTPNPVSQTQGTRVERLEPHQKVLFRLYLLGKLAHNCQQSCPSGLHNA